MSRKKRVTERESIYFIEEKNVSKNWKLICTVVDAQPTIIVVTKRKEPIAIISTPTTDDRRFFSSKVQKKLAVARRSYLKTGGVSAQKFIDRVLGKPFLFKVIR